MFHHKIVIFEYFFIIDLFYAYMHALLEFQVSEHLNAHYGVMHPFVHTTPLQDAIPELQMIEDQAPQKGKRFSPTVQARSLGVVSKWSSRLAAYCHGYHAVLMRHHMICTCHHLMCDFKNGYQVWQVWCQETFESFYGSSLHKVSSSTTRPSPGGGGGRQLRGLFPWRQLVARSSPFLQLVHPQVNPQEAAQDAQHASTLLLVSLMVLGK